MEFHLPLGRQQVPYEMGPYLLEVVRPCRAQLSEGGFIVPILITTVLAPLVGFGVIIGMYLWPIRTPAKMLRDHRRLGAVTRDFWDLTAALFGLLKGFAMVYVSSSF